MSTSRPKKSGMYMTARFAALLGVRPDDMPRSKQPEADFDPIGDDVAKGKKEPSQGDDDAEDYAVGGSFFNRRWTWRPAIGQIARQRPIPGISTVIGYSDGRATA